MAIGLAAMGLAAAQPALAESNLQESAFARDRNVAVDERSHPEYAPLDIRFGSLILQPQLDVGLAYTDDVFSTNAAPASDFDLHIAPILNIQSNWTRNLLTAYVKASYDQFFKYTTEDSPQVSLGASYKLDTIKNSYFLFSGNYANEVESRSATNYNLNLVNPLRYQTVDFSGSSVTEINRLRYTAFASAQVYSYYKDRQKTGGYLNVSGYNGDVFQQHGQVEYAINPGTAVYYYIGGNELRYPTSVGGLSRNSEGFDTAIGTNFDVTRLVRGDIRIGYLHQFYQAHVASVGGLSLQASADYFPTQLTTVVFSAARQVQSTNVPTAASMLDESASVTVEHELFRNIILSGGGSFERDTYNGSCSTPGCVYGRRDNRWAATVGASYLLNRRVRLKFDYSRVAFDSTGPQRAPSYTTDLFQLTTSLRY